MIWHHGSWDGWQGWREDGPAWSGHWNAYLGIHFSERLETAREFAAGSYIGASMHEAWMGEVVAVRLHLERPYEVEGELDLATLALRVVLEQGLASEEELDRWSQAHGVSWWEMATGADPGPLWLVDDLLNFCIGPAVVGAAVKAHLQARGFDGVIYGNGYEALGEKTAIAFSAMQIEVLQRSGLGEEEKSALAMA